MADGLPGSSQKIDSIKNQNAFTWIIMLFIWKVGYK
jgi:hypothetical protein